MEKRAKLYSGKVKTLFETNDPERLIVHHSDTATAFNAAKQETFSGKGLLNNHINAFLMTELGHLGVETHFESLFSEQASVVKKLDMISVECVVRNIAAGSLTRRLGIPVGQRLSKPLFEFYLKDDSLGDPFINADHILTFDWATEVEISKMQAISLEINQLLSQIFQKASLILVDFKLEFGRYKGKIVLGDEITPDGCRIWDTRDGEILDKDRFRQDMGNIIESYALIAQKLGVALPVSLQSQ